MHASDFRKIDLICAREEEEDRPELQNVYLCEGYLYASNGYIAARLPARPTDQDTDGLIPAQAVAMARGANSIITANETVRVSTRRCTFDRPTANLWPENIDKMNKADLHRPGAQPETHNPTVILDVRQLWDLARAICGNDLLLKIYLGQSDRDPVLVKPVYCGDDVLGVIMPVCSLCSPKDGKADLWHALGQLREHIDNSTEKVCLTGDLLAELRKALCVESSNQEKEP